MHLVIWTVPLFATVPHRAARSPLTTWTLTPTARPPLTLLRLHLPTTAGSPSQENFSSCWARSSHGRWIPATRTRRHLVSSTGSHTLSLQCQTVQMSSSSWSGCRHPQDIPCLLLRLLACLGPELLLWVTWLPSPCPAQMSTEHSFWLWSVQKGKEKNCASNIK